ncbi:MAG: NAD(P)-dependent oxidoreductase [Sandaracinaceae bacterium]|nr:NAD(P)-dependent oxidoreductase [Sandaracinaceae bacterium]
MSVLPQKLQGKALITGASGFIGSNLRRALLDAGVDVVAIRRGASPEADEGRSVVARYDDVAALTKLVAEEKPDWVFHVAGATKGVTYQDFQRANVMPTRNLLAALLEGHPDVKRFVMVSSLAAYGPSTKTRPLRESDTPKPLEHYGRSKLEAEHVVRAMGGSLPWTIIRPSGVYGPGDADYFNLFKEVTSGRNVFFGNRERWFSAIYVDDCVRGIVAAATSDAANGKGYFLCDGHPITWGTFQDAIVAAHGKRVRTLNLPEFFVGVAAIGGELATKVDGKPRLFNRQKAKMGAQEAWTCTHDAARADFGYAPEVQVEDGVARAYAWYREHGWM